jgi:hypothetical protein
MFLKRVSSQMYGRNSHLIDLKPPSAGRYGMSVYQIQLFDGEIQFAGSKGEINNGQADKDEKSSKDEKPNNGQADKDEKPNNGQADKETSFPPKFIDEVGTPSCTVCLSNKSSLVFDCGHVCTCYSCATGLPKIGGCISCPICRSPVFSAKRVFLM